MKVFVNLSGLCCSGCVLLLFSSCLDILRLPDDSVKAEKSCCSICSNSQLRWNCAFFLWTNTNHLFMCVFILGIDFKIKTVELQGKKIKLQIWWVTGRTGCGVASPRMASFKGRFSWGYTQLSHFVTGLYFQLRWSSMRVPLNCF